MTFKISLIRESLRWSGAYKIWRKNYWSAFTCYSLHRFNKETHSWTIAVDEEWIVYKSGKRKSSCWKRKKIVFTTWKDGLPMQNIKMCIRWAFWFICSILKSRHCIQRGTFDLLKAEIFEMRSEWSNKYSLCHQDKATSHISLQFGQKLIQLCVCVFQLCIRVFR